MAPTFVDNKGSCFISQFYKTAVFILSFSAPYSRSPSLNSVHLVALKSTTFTLPTIDIAAHFSWFFIPPNDRQSSFS